MTEKVKQSVNCNTAKNCEIATIGNGPTGIAFLLYATRNNLLKKTKEKKYGIIGPLENFGSGNLNYNIMANSNGGDVLSTVPEKLLNSINPKILLEINKYRNSLSPLTLIAKLESEIAKVLYGIIEKNDGLNYFDNLAAAIVIDDPKNGAEILDSAGNPITQNTKNIILAPGGSQKISKDLEKYKEKVIFSDDFFKLSDEEIIQKFKKGEKIVIKGGAHSAFSAVHSLLTKHPLSSTFSIKILNKSPVKVYYESGIQAKKEGYSVGQTDIIDDQNGAINRYTGIRGNAKQIYKEILEGKYKNIKIFTNDKNEEKNLHDSDKIIQCFGYEPNQVPIVDSKGDSLVEGQNFKVDPNTYLLENLDPEILNKIQIFYKALGALNKISVNQNQGPAIETIGKQIFNL